MPNTISYQRNANESHNEVSPPTHPDGYIIERQRITSVGDGKFKLL
jgi:hypothetical protein